MIKNIKFTPRFINFVQIGVAVFIGFILCTILFNPFVIGEVNHDLIKPYTYTGEARVEFDNGHSRNVKLPTVIHTRQPFTVTIPFSNFGMIDGKTLSFITKDSLIRCEVDNTIIYRNIPPRNVGNYFDGNMMYFIDLPETVHNKMITLHFQYDKGYLTSFELKDVKVGSRANILVDYFLRQDIFGVCVILLLFTLSTAIFLTTFTIKDITQDLKYFTQVGLLCLFIAIYIIASLPIMYFFLYRHRAVLNFLRYTMPMLMLLPFLNAIFLALNFTSKKPVIIGFVLSLLNIIIQHALTLAGFATLTEMDLFTSAVILYSFVVFGWAFFTNNNFKLKKHTLISLSPLVIGVCIEIFICKLGNIPPMTVTFLPFIFIFFILQAKEYFEYLTLNWKRQKEANLYRELAMRDGLTGLGSRLAYKDALEARQNAQFGFFCILLDIDCLKIVNDNLGHKEGDKIILKLALLLKQSFPADRSDIYRIGGDEFVVFYKSINETELSTLLESIALEYAKKSEDDKNNVPYGVSYGFSYFTPGKNLESVMHEADSRMYERKSAKKCKSRSNYTETIKFN